MYGGAVKYSLDQVTVDMKKGDKMWIDMMAFKVW
jgi:hypothetical protein